MMSTGVMQIGRTGHRRLDRRLARPDALGHGRLGHEERMFDLRCRKATDCAQGQRDLRGRAEWLVTAHALGVVLARDQASAPEIEGPHVQAL